LLLTARSEDYSQVAGFDAGADDYITKPIKPKLLVSKVKALLRRLKKRNKIAKHSVLKLIAKSIKLLKTISKLH
jgi:DNA-binding response OmpR family regulator